MFDISASDYSDLYRLKIINDFGFSGISVSVEIEQCGVLNTNGIIVTTTTTTAATTTTSVETSNQGSLNTSSSNDSEMLSVVLFCRVSLCFCVSFCVLGECYGVCVCVCVFVCVALLDVSTDIT